MGRRIAPADRYFADHPDVVSTNRQFGELDAFLDSSNIPRPYFHPHLGTNAAMVHMFGRHLVNFSSYDYLGMSSDPRVQKRAKDAIDTYGTSVSASRIVSGEIPLHGELEARIAAWHGVDDALVTTSGYLTNAAVVGYLLGPDDVAVCDSLVHSSIVSGTRWSGCRRINFRHNDPASLEAILAASRHKYARAMLIVEGLYSMDGDTPPLPELIAIARRYDCAVMVDEAHSFGVLGPTAKVSKKFGGCPATPSMCGWGHCRRRWAAVADSLPVTANCYRALKYSAPGLSAFAIGATAGGGRRRVGGHGDHRAGARRVARVQALGERMGELCRERGFDIGSAEGTPITPAILGGKTGMASVRLIEAGINVGAILAPAVAAGQERLRFFVTSEHTEEQLETSVAALDDVLRSLPDQ